jgi:hypothetical protein
MTNLLHMLNRVSGELIEQLHEALLSHVLVGA